MKKILSILFSVLIFAGSVGAQNMEGENKMKTIIVYKSQTGFTKQYAEWISEETGFEAVELKKVSKEQIQNADRVVYGESIKADNLMNLSKIRNMNPKNLVIFAVGLTEPSPEYPKKLAEVNQTGDIPLYYMHGGVRFSKLDFFSRLILKKVTGLTEDVDYTNKDYIKEIVEYLKA